MGTAPTKTARGRIRAIIVDPRSLAMLPAISFAVFAAGGVEAMLGFAIVAHRLWSLPAHGARFDLRQFWLMHAPGLQISTAWRICLNRHLITMHPCKLRPSLYASTS